MRMNNQTDEKQTSFHPVCNQIGETPNRAASFTSRGPRRDSLFPRFMLRMRSGVPDTFIEASRSEMPNSSSFCLMRW